MLIVENYLVFYVIMDDETVEIRRIISGKRDYQFLL
jgi:toxin ParE1/3/4